jgi:hypothetical protein
MSLSHKLQKLKIYFFPKDQYWKRIEHQNWAVQSPTGPFFRMHLKDRLYDNHYDKFDENGLPIRQGQDGSQYNYTTLCSFALANWEVYLETGDKKHTEPLLKVYDFLKKNHEVTSYGGVVFPHGSLLSAMNQGEALCVLARCYELDPDPEIIAFAEKILKSYQVPVSERGVLGQFKGYEDIYWYEEKAVVPPQHILNGMCYALIGLYDIHQAIPSLKQASTLWENGIRYLESTIHEFDTGNWSWYWQDETKPNYIASMMYHNLHIVQLNYIADITNKEIFKHYAALFSQYQSKGMNRIKAGLMLIKGKLVK